MRIAWTVLLIVGLAPWAQAETLFFVGDADNVEASDSLQGVARTWPMSAAGHDAKETTFETVGPQDEGTYNNDAIPTYIYDGTIEVGDGGITVYVYVNDSNQLACNSLDGQLFDGSGTALGPANFRVDIDGHDEVVEMVFEFKDVSGTIEGLAFQAGSPWADCGALPYTFHWGSDAAPGRVEFAAPALPAGPSVIYEDLNGPTVAINDTLDGASEIHQFNWTQGTSAVNVSFDAIVEEGTASVSVHDASGAIVYEQAFAEDAAGTAQIDGAVAGNWTILVNYTAFSGSLLFDLVPADGQPGGPGTGGPGPSASPTGPTGNATGNQTDEQGEKSPLPALPALVVGMGAIAWLRRRWS